MDGPKAKGLRFFSANFADCEFFGRCAGHPVDNSSNGEILLWTPNTLHDAEYGFAIGAATGRRGIPMDIEMWVERSLPSLR